MDFENKKIAFKTNLQHYFYTNSLCEKNNYKFALRKKKDHMPNILISSYVPIKKRILNPNLKRDFQKLDDDDKRMVVTFL